MTNEPDEDTKHEFQYGVPRYVPFEEPDIPKLEDIDFDIRDYYPDEVKEVTIESFQLPDKSPIQMFLEMPFDSPTLFKLSAILHSLSWTVGRYFTWNGIRMNSMFILSSSPGVFHRSTLVELDEKIRWGSYKLFKSYLEKYEGRVTDIRKECFDEYELKSGTQQGFRDKIETTQAGYTYKCDNIANLDVPLFAWTDGEFGLTISQHEFILELISKLKEAEVYKFNLSQKGKANNVSTTAEFKARSTLLGSMQDPELYLGVKDNQQGAMRRVVFVYGTPDQIDIDKLILPSQFSRMKNVRNKMIENINKKLGLEMFKAHTHIFNLKPEIRNFIQLNIPIDIQAQIDGIYITNDKEWKANPYHLDTMTRVTDWLHYVQVLGLFRINRIVAKKEAEDKDWKKDWNNTKLFMQKIDVNRREANMRIALKYKTDKKWKLPYIEDMYNKNGIEEVFSKVDSMKVDDIFDCLMHLQLAGRVDDLKVLQMLLEKIRQHQF